MFFRLIAALFGGGRRRGRWVEPEYLPDLEAQDLALGRTRFYVYVLETDRGFYVGHSYHVGRRYAAHRAGRVPSTEGLNPRLVWTSKAFRTRRDAARFEAALKSLHASRNPCFAEITGTGRNKVRGGE